MSVQQTQANSLSAQSSLFTIAHQSDTSPVDLVQVYCALPPPLRQRRFFSTAGIADKFGIPQRTVQDWISNGRIAAVKVGKKYHVDALSVEAYLQQCTQPR